MCLALCPNALEALTKDKSWQCFIIDLLILCQSRYYDQGRLNPSMSALNARLRAYLHGGGGPQVCELTRVTRLFI